MSKLKYTLSVAFIIFVLSGCSQIEQTALFQTEEGDSSAAQNAPIPAAIESEKVSCGDLEVAFDRDRANPDKFAGADDEIGCEGGELITITTSPQDQLGYKYVIVGAGDPGGYGGYSALFFKRSGGEWVFAYGTQAALYCDDTPYNDLEVRTAYANYECFSDVGETTVREYYELK